MHHFTYFTIYQNSVHRSHFSGTHYTIKCVVVCIYEYVPDVTFNFPSFEDTSRNESFLTKADGNGLGPLVKYFDKIFFALQTRNCKANLIFYLKERKKWLWLLWLSIFLFLKTQVEIKASQQKRMVMGWDLLSNILTTFSLHYEIELTKQT